MVETPWDALGPTLQETVHLGLRSFQLERPDETEKLLEHPFVHQAFAEDEYMPYWVDLWPSARMLAKATLQCAEREVNLLQSRVQPAPGKLVALEVGCGLGLPGIAALSCGMYVHFSDYDLTALAFAARNAELNGFARGQDFETLPLDWRDPPAGFQVPVVLGADLIYEVRNVAPLVALIKQVLAPGGVCLLTDQDRVPSSILRQTLKEQGLTFTTRTVRAGEPGKPRIKGTLYRISHREWRTEPAKQVGHNVSTS